MDEKTIVDIFGRLLGEQTKRLEKQFTEIREDISSLKEDVSSLKEDVSSLKEDVSSLKEDVSSLKEDVSSLKKDVAALDKKIDDKTDELKEYIDNNNLAIGEVMTEALERADVKTTKLESEVRFLRQG